MTALACETIVDGGGPTGDMICGGPATGTATAGCVHEHFETGPICRRHGEQLCDQVLICPACKRCPDPHVCVMLGRVVA